MRKFIILNVFIAMVPLYLGFSLYKDIARIKARSIIVPGKIQLIKQVRNIRRSRHGTSSFDNTYYFKYQYKEKSYSGSYNPILFQFLSFREGEKVDVLVDPKNPESANIDSFFTIWEFPLMALFFAVVLANPCLVYFKYKISVQWRIYSLAKNGKKIWGTIKKIKPGPFQTKYVRSYYYVVQFTSFGIDKIGKSDLLFEIGQAKPGDQVRVITSKKNLSDYAVDTSEIRKKVRRRRRKTRLAA